MVKTLSTTNIRSAFDGTSGEHALRVFLHHHGDSLVSFRLNNVVVAEQSLYPGSATSHEDVQAEMLSALKAMKRDLVNLESASIRLQRVTCCVQCPHYVGNPAVVLIHQDGRARVEASDIEMVAQELGVMEKNGIWDFGEYIMGEDNSQSFEDK